MLQERQALFIDQYGNQQIRLDNFILDNKTRWDQVKAAISSYEGEEREVFFLTYQPQFCSKYTLAMSSDGQAAVYGCCGK